MKFRYSVFLFFSIFISLVSIQNSHAQNATIRGFVYEKENGEPVIFTNVYLKKTTYGASTDVNGYFAISMVPPGNYTLMITSLGYDSIVQPIVLQGGEVLSKKLFLTKTMYNLKTFNVSAEKQESKTETKTSVVKISPKQVKSLPTVGGQADLAQYLQVLPGVIFTGDQGGQLYIRGGSPIQNKVLLDGMVIYNPFHSIGLFSVFDTDILRNADVYTGGFGAEYGGRISSVMDIKTRDGNKKRYSGKFDASTFGAKILLEGPIVKQTDSSRGSSSFILSFKNSYLKESSKLFYNYIDTAGLPFNFSDFYAKLSFNTTSGSKINFFGFNFSDNVNYKAVSEFNWKSFGLGTNFVVVPANSSSLIEGIVSYSRYNIALKEASLAPRTSEINGFNIGMYFTTFSGKNQWKYGFELNGFTTNFDYFNNLNRKIAQKENTTEISGFMKYKWVLGNFVLEPGLRLQYYASLSNASLEPRLAIKFNASNKIRFKFAGGWYSQNLISATSDRDIVNLFYGFLSGPDNLPEKFDGKEVTHKLQKSQHIIVGMEWDINKNLNINIEGYYKFFSQLSEINRNKIFDDNADYSTKPDYFKKDFIIENGDAEGVDFSLKYEYKNIYFWAVYSLGFVNRYDGYVTYVTHYDRRHNINIVATYQWGKFNCWEASARWNLGSGFPFTQTQGFYGIIPFTGGVSTDYTTVNESIGIQYADYNQARLPWYHRLDVNLKRKIRFSETVILEINAGVTNAYNRENIFYYDRIKNERVNQLPLMWNFGMGLTF